MALELGWLTGFQSSRRCTDFLGKRLLKKTFASETNSKDRTKERRTKSVRERQERGSATCLRWREAFLSRDLELSSDPANTPLRFLKKTAQVLSANP